jgi:hypothetical protein
LEKNVKIIGDWKLVRAWNYAYCHTNYLHGSAERLHRRMT